MVSSVMGCADSLSVIVAVRWQALVVVECGHIKWRLSVVAGG